MKFKHQILALGLIGVLSTALVGGIGSFQTSRLSEEIARSEAMSSALQSSQKADMMHDAIRSDVLLLVQGVSSQNANQMAEASKGLEEHANIFSQTLEQLDDQPLTSEVKAMLEATKPMVKAYIAAAKNAQDLAANDLTAAGSAIDGFQVAFSKLEDQMAILSEGIAKSVEAERIESHANVSSSKFQVIVAWFVSTLLLVTGAMFLARELTQPVVRRTPLGRLFPDAVCLKKESDQTSNRNSLGFECRLKTATKVINELTCSN